MPHYEFGTYIRLHFVIPPDFSMKQNKPNKTAMFITVKFANLIPYLCTKTKARPLYKNSTLSLAYGVFLCFIGTPVILGRALLQKEKL